MYCTIKTKFLTRQHIVVVDRKPVYAALTLNSSVFGSRMGFANPFKPSLNTQKLTLVVLQHFRHM